MKQISGASWTGFGKGSVRTGTGNGGLGALHYHMEGNKVMACVNASLLNEHCKAQEAATKDGKGDV